MVKCSAPNKPDCEHECTGETCTAFYEEETGMCIRGCDGVMVSVGMARALQVSGWFFKSSVEAKGILGSQLLMAGALVRGFLRQETSATLKGVPSPAIAPLADEVIALGRSAFDRRFAFSWSNAPLHAALTTIRDVMKG